MRTFLYEKKKNLQFQVKKIAFCTMLQLYIKNIAQHTLLFTCSIRFLKIITGKKCLFVYDKHFKDTKKRKMVCLHIAQHLGACSLKLVGKLA